MKRFLSLILSLALTSSAVPPAFSFSRLDGTHRFRAAESFSSQALMAQGLSSMRHILVAVPLLTFSKLLLSVVLISSPIALANSPKRAKKKVGQPQPVAKIVTVERSAPFVFESQLKYPNEKKTPPLLLSDVHGNPTAVIWNYENSKWQLIFHTDGTQEWGITPAGRTVPYRVAMTPEQKTFFLKEMKKGDNELKALEEKLENDLKENTPAPVPQQGLLVFGFLGAWLERLRRKLSWSRSAPTVAKLGRYLRKRDIERSREAEQVEARQHRFISQQDASQPLPYVYPKVTYTGRYADLLRLVTSKFFIQSTNLDLSQEPRVIVDYGIGAFPINSIAFKDGLGNKQIRLIGSELHSNTPEAYIEAESTVHELRDAIASALELSDSQRIKHVVLSKNNRGHISEILVEIALDDDQTEYRTLCAVAPYELVGMDGRMDDPNALLQSLAERIVQAILIAPDRKTTSSPTRRYLSDRGGEFLSSDNLTTQLPQTADLLIVSNMTFYLVPSARLKFLRGLSTILKDRGVLLEKIQLDENHHFPANLIRVYQARGKNLVLLGEILSADFNARLEIKAEHNQPFYKEVKRRRALVLQQASALIGSDVARFQRLAVSAQFEEHLEDVATSLHIPDERLGSDFLERVEGGIALQASGWSVVASLFSSSVVGAHLFQGSELQPLVTTVFFASLLLATSLSLFQIAVWVSRLPIAEATRFFIQWQGSTLSRKAEAAVRKAA